VSKLLRMTVYLSLWTVAVIQKYLHYFQFLKFLMSALAKQTDVN